MTRAVYTCDNDRRIIRDGVAVARLGMVNPDTREGWEHFGPADLDKLARQIPAALNDAPRMRAALIDVRQRLKVYLKAGCDCPACEAYHAAGDALGIARP